MLDPGEACTQHLVNIGVCTRLALVNLLTLPRRIGEGRHVMTYTISGGRSFNMVLSHVDKSDPASWTQDAALEDMRQHFQDWDPQ
jgi:hypothetical protein